MYSLRLAKAAGGRIASMSSAKCAQFNNQTATLFNTSSISQLATISNYSNLHSKIQRFNLAYVNCERRQPLSLSSNIKAAHEPHTIKTVHDRVMLICSLYDNIDAEKLTLDSDLYQDMGLGSLDFVELIIVLEDEFFCEIPDGDMDRLKTPRQIAQYLCDKFDVYH
ncbi:phosphopantetheine attachment site domain-containing protein [Ditylenchus destructor]|nr:phosphopantetheine attachment site domain-containing protein [Ditylenchus destructor]